MFHDNSLAFIKERISEIRSALIYSLSDELIKFPTSIISILKIDDDGQLWFFIKRPVAMLIDAEMKFPARLQFYRKGKPFYLNVDGWAGIDEDQQLINQFTDYMENKSSSVAMQNMMLVKLQITRAEYHEHKPLVSDRNFIKNGLRRLYDGMMKPSYYYRPMKLKPELA